MPAIIKFANGDILRVEEDPRQVLKAIQAADEIGPLMIAEVNGRSPVYVNVDQISTVTSA